MYIYTTMLICYISRLDQILSHISTNLAPLHITPFTSAQALLLLAVLRSRHLTYSYILLHSLIYPLIFHHLVQPQFRTPGLAMVTGARDGIDFAFLKELCSYSLNIITHSCNAQKLLGSFFFSEVIMCSSSSVLIDFF